MPAKREGPENGVAASRRRSAGGCIRALVESQCPGQRRRTRAPLRSLGSHDPFGSRRARRHRCPRAHSRRRTAARRKRGAADHRQADAATTRRRCGSPLRRRASSRTARPSFSIPARRRRRSRARSAGSSYARSTSSRMRSTSRSLLANAHHVNLIIPGGVLRRKSWSLSGPQAEQALRDSAGGPVVPRRRQPGSRDRPHDAARARSEAERADDPHRASDRGGDRFLEAAAPQPVGDRAGRAGAPPDHRPGRGAGCGRGHSRAWASRSGSSDSV